MKRFLLLLAVMALSVSLAQAGSFRIDPPLGGGPIDAGLGDKVSYTVYFETSVDMYVAGYELMIAYDANVFAYLAPPPDLIPPWTPAIIPGSFMDAKPDFSNPGFIRLYALLGEGYEVLPAGEVEMFTLDFEVISCAHFDGISDCQLLEQLPEDPYGILAYDWNIGGDATFKYNGALGAMLMPEPTTMALLGIGLAGALLRKKS